MEQAEWLRRYAQRMIDVGKLTPKQALDAATCESFERLSEDFEDEPEEAADMEMSYWTD